MIFISQALAGFFVFGIGQSQYFFLFSLTRNPVDLVERFYGRRTFQNGPPEVHLMTWPLVVAVAATTALAALIVIWRYHRVQVTR